MAILTYTKLFLLLMGALVLNQEKNDISLEKDLLIGPESTDQEIIFSGWVQHLYVDDNGNIFVADSGQSTVFRFSENGNLVSKIGAEGRGPGEFTRLTPNVWVSGDTLFTYDTNQFRYTEFDVQEGTVIDTKVIDPRLEMDEIFYQPSQLYYDFKRGNIVFEKTSPYSNGTGHIERSKIFYTYNTNFDVIQNDLLILPADESYIEDSGNSISVSGLLPFSRKSKVSQGIDEYGNHLCYGWTEKISIECIDMRSGERLTSFELEHTNITINNEDLNEKLSIFPESGNLNRSDIRSEIKHNSWPAFDWFTIDDEGNFWIASNAESRENYKLYKTDYEGNLLSEISFPKSDHIITVRNGYAYAISESDIGEKTIIRYKINYS